MKSKLNTSFYNFSIDIDTGRRIDNFLHTHLKGIPKSLIYCLLRKGKIRINRKMILPEYKLQYGDNICIPILWKPQKINFLDLKKVPLLNNYIIYEDQDLIALNKPSGTAVHRGSKIKFNIIEGLKLLRPKTNFLELVHRLDRDTSGVLLVAKKNHCLRELHRQLRLKEIRKEYLALVHGQWPSHIQLITALLLKNVLANGKHRMQVHSHGKYSETKFKIEERFSQATLVKIVPVTGRTHQIRVHAKYAGYPIAFDKKYGDNIYDKKLSNCGLNRIFLHASAIYFIHPNQGIKMCIQAPLDNKLKKCLLYLRNINNTCNIIK